MSTRRSFLFHTAAATITASTTALGSELEKPRAILTASKANAKSPVKSTADQLRLAIVGTGQISHRYLKQAAASNRAHFVATCARTIESAKERATEYGIDAWFDDYLMMLDKVKPDAVVIATPTTLHASQAIAAFQRGINVLCEKPMAATLEDCQAMVLAAERSGKTFLSLPYDDTPQMKAAFSQLNEQTLGVFTGAEAHLLLPGASRDNWYYDKKIAGGGAGLDTLVYPVSRLVTLLGPAKRVSGFVNTLIPHRILGDGKTIDVLPPSRRSTKAVESTVDDNATLLIEWANGQQATARALWGTSCLRNDTTIYGRHGTLWLAGKDVIVHSPEKSITGATAVNWNGYERCYNIPYEPLTNIKDEGLLEHFVACIQGQSKPTAGATQTLHVHEILFKGYEAARSGRAQELETSFTPWRAPDAQFYDTRSRPI